MKEYHKINSLFKRDTKGKIIENAWSLPEFEYLKDNIWVFSEKVDGTNCRIDWDKEKLRFGGRTENSQMPIYLLEKLQELFPIEKFRTLYPDIPMTLYGEGYGAKIQKGGGNYKSDGVSFVLFDILVDKWWLQRHNLEDIASKLEIEVIPIIGEGTLESAISIIKKGLLSKWGNFKAEGLVLKPKIELKNRNGNRIITKVKHGDF